MLVPEMQKSNLANRNKIGRRSKGEKRDRAARTESQAATCRQADLNQTISSRCGRRSR